MLPQRLETSLLVIQQERAPFKSHQGHHVISERNKEAKNIISLIREGKKEKGKKGR
jgi:hypothetical protein